MFEPKNLRVPGVGLAPQRATPEVAHEGLVDALFVRGHATDERSQVVVRIGSVAGKPAGTPVAQQQAAMSVACGGTAAEA